MNIGFVEGKHIHTDDGHDAFVAFAKESCKSPVFVKNVCMDVACRAPEVLVTCILGWTYPSTILITEERAQEFAEKYPEVIHFFYNEP